MNKEHDKERRTKKDRHEISLMKMETKRLNSNVYTLN